MSRIAEVLAALREERQSLLHEVSRIDRAIAALEDAAEVEAIPPATAQPMAAGRTPGPYSMLDFYDAAFAYLKAAGEPKSTREIADALRDGGYRTYSKNFAGTAGTMLRRPTTSQVGIRKHRDGKRWYVDS